MDEANRRFGERKAMLEALCRDAGVQFASQIDPDQNQPLKTHIPAIDNLAGGIPKNTLTEAIEPHVSCGGTFLLHRLLDQTKESRGYAALVDGSDSFSPNCISDSLTLEHLFWVRCRDCQEALRVGDLIAGDGNFSIIVLDLRLNPPSSLRAIPNNRWYRLQRSLKKANCTGIVLTNGALVSAAKLRFRLTHRFTLGALQQSQLFLQEQLQVETLAETRIAHLG